MNVVLTILVNKIQDKLHFQSLTFVLYVKMILNVSNVSDQSLTFWYCVKIIHAVKYWRKKLKWLTMLSKYLFLCHLSSHICCYMSLLLKNKIKYLKLVYYRLQFSFFFFVSFSFICFLRNQIGVKIPKFKAQKISNQKMVQQCTTHQICIAALFVQFIRQKFQTVKNSYYN